MYRILIFLLLISTASFGQVMQERNASGVDRRIILKDGFRLPQVCWVTGNPNLLNYSAYNSKGAMVYDTCAGKIKRWDGSAWVAVQDSMAAGGGGDYVDTIYRKAGQDSIFFTINGGAERAIKDSLGGGGGITSDSLAIRKAGRNLIHMISHNSGYNSATVGSSAAGARVDSANLFIGLRAGAAGTTGYRNIGIGRAAMKATTTGHTGIAIGDSAIGTGAYTGSGLIAIGQRALVAATTAVNDIAIGLNALGAKTTASTQPNVAIGQNAMANMPGGGTGDNVAIGTSAMFNGNNNAANFNVAIGRSAMQSITTGAGNVGIGYYALGQLTTGNSNVSIGTNLFNNGLTSASGTVFIGSSGGTLAGNHTGIFYLSGGGGSTYTLGAGTTSIGYLANRHTGSFNTAIGYGALMGGSAITAAQGEDSSTAIGYFAGGSTSTGTSSTMNRGAGTYIGYKAGEGPINAQNYTGNELVAIGVLSASSQTAGDYNTAIGRVNLASATGSNQLAIGGNGIGWIRQDVSGSLRRTLLNATTSDVTTFTISAALEINGTNGAVLFPRLTTTQRDALTATNGMVLYNSTTDKLQVYAAGAWVDLH